MDVAVEDDVGPEDVDPLLWGHVRIGFVVKWAGVVRVGGEGDGGGVEGKGGGGNFSV